MSTLSPLGYKIFLDRYALKDQERTTLQVGDTVLVITNKDTGQREVGQIMQLEKRRAMVAFNEEETPYWHMLDQIDKPTEIIPAQMIARVARAVAANERDYDGWYNEFVSIMQNWDFIPAGRILAAAGNPGALTFYNCFVLPCPTDSRGGIFERLAQMAEIMSRGGGVGINISSLRPKKAYVKGVNGRSSGAVSWGGLFSTVTGLIEQGGSRRGACMIIMNDWHPDIEEFINSKREAGKITNANISVALSNEFMDAVENDSDWTLMFPDTSDPEYDALWDGNRVKWASLGKAFKVYKVMPARELWQQITASAHASAEPGIWFQGRSEEMSNSYYYDSMVATNPCAEQPLPAWSVCNLGAINLSNFYDKEWTVDWTRLARTIDTAVRFLDNVIDITPYFFDQNEQQQLKERRIGLNTMGLAELLIKNGIRYGSDKSIEFINALYAFIRDIAYQASINLAIQRGSFPAFDAEKFLNSGFAKTLPNDIANTIRRHGLRNVTLLTQAPNGSIGTMLNTSTGIEPFFSFRWTRKSRLGSHEEYMQIAQDWIDQNPGKDLPDYFVTAQELTPAEHVRVQAAIQYYIDSAISKTVNLPSYYTVEDVQEVYEQMYATGCKGGTVYRDQSRADQVLYTKTATTTVQGTTMTTAVTMSIVNTKDCCPECQSENFVRQDGCVDCADCGYSLCKI